MNMELVRSTNAVLTLSSYEMGIIVASLAVATGYKAEDGYALPNIWKDDAERMIADIEKHYTIYDGCLENHKVL